MAENKKQGGKEEKQTLPPQEQDQHTNAQNVHDEALLEVMIMARMAGTRVRPTHRS